MIRALVVDDREENRYYLTALLKGSGYDVESAANGAEALSLALQNPPQLVISDLLMPVMDGYTLLRKWRADARLKFVPFIVYTATYTDPKDERLAIDLGADAFILKPTEAEDLLARIHETLRTHASRHPMAPSTTEGAGLTKNLPEATHGEETRILEQYSVVLIRKLEDKMEQSYRANSQLHQTIAERVKVESQLRESEQKYRELVEHANSIILRWTADGKITFLNEFGQRFFGYAQSEIVGQSVFGTVLANTEATDRDLRSMMKQIAADPKGFEQSLSPNTCRDGRRVWVAWTNKAVTDGQGEVKEILSIGTDITERKNLEEQFRQAQKLESIGQLASGVAHDFNNILTIILGNAALLLGSGQLSGEDGELAKEIIAAAERAAGLTRQLLLFSRKQEMQLSRVSLNEVTADMAKLLKRVLGEDIKLVSIYYPNLPPINADIGVIEQVLLNLAVNARDAMPKGGLLEISTSVEDLPPDQIQADDPVTGGRYVCLKVTDTGCGIPPEHLSRIFDPFFTTKAIGKGTGLGLATVYGAVKQHRGWVSVTSQVGKGTSFQIFFPVSSALPEAEKAELTVELPTGNEVILSVEDDPNVRLVVNQLLQRCGYRVLTAVSGVAALELWREHKDSIQLLLTDVIMPDGVTGRDLADKLRKDKPELKVIYSSGYCAEVLTRGQALVEGSCFLQKPYSPSQLARLVRNCLDQKVKRSS
jgi:PAS domain S-box-containing protein